MAVILISEHYRSGICHAWNFYGCKKREIDSERKENSVLLIIKFKRYIEFNLKVYSGIKLTYRNSNIAINRRSPFELHSRSNRLRRSSRGSRLPSSLSLSLSLSLSKRTHAVLSKPSAARARNAVGVPARNDTSVSSVFAHAYWERRFVVARRILPLAAVPAAAILLPADDARRPRMQEPRVIGAHRRMTTPPAYSVARDASVIRGYVKKYTYTEAHTDNVMRAWSRKVGPLWGVSSRQIRRQPRHGTTHRSSSARPSVTPRERDTYTYTYTKARAHANPPHINTSRVALTRALVESRVRRLPRTTTSPTNRARSTQLYFPLSRISPTWSHTLPWATPHRARSFSRCRSLSLSAAISFYSGYAIGEFIIKKLIIGGWGKG